MPTNTNISKEITDLFNIKKRDNYSPEETAEIISKARLTLIRLKSIIPNKETSKDILNEYKESYSIKDLLRNRLGVTIEILTIFLTIAFIFSVVLKQFYASDSEILKFINENELLVTSVSTLIFVIPVFIILYNKYKENKRTIFLKQAIYLADRLEELLSRYENIK